MRFNIDFQSNRWSRGRWNCSAAILGVGSPDAVLEMPASSGEADVLPIRDGDSQLNSVAALTSIFVIA